MRKERASVAYMPRECEASLSLPLSLLIAIVIRRPSSCMDVLLLYAAVWSVVLAPWLQGAFLLLTQCTNKDL